MSSDTEAAPTDLPAEPPSASKKRSTSTNSATTTATYDAKAIQVLEGALPGFSQVQA